MSCWTISYDDEDFDYPSLWAAIDSVEAAASLKRISNDTKLNSDSSCSFSSNAHSPADSNRTRSRCGEEDARSLKMVKHNTDSGSAATIRTGSSSSSPETRHCLSGMFPSVSLFNDFRTAAMAILEKTDYVFINGSNFIKKSGWRKIAFYFNLSFEIKDKTIEFDDNRNVVRSEFIVRAFMRGGRFSDGWGSCDRREKRFVKPNHDIPSTAETRAKNKACQDLLGIGEYRPSATHCR